MEQAPKKAWDDFEKRNYPIFNRFKYPPKAYVAFQSMHKSGADCNDLIEKTAAALSSEELQQLFLSTQQTNIEICLKYGIQKIALLTDLDLSTYHTEARGDWTCFIALVLKYFPNVWIGYQFFKEYEFTKDGRRRTFKEFEEEEEGFLEFIEEEEKFFDTGFPMYDLISLSKIMSPILSYVNFPINFNLKEALYCAIVAAIIGHLHFFLVKESSDNKPTLEQAVQTYTLASTYKNAINLQSVENLFKASSVDDAPLLKIFKHSHVDKNLLVEGAVQMALDNLLWKY